jgi:hypothetical protein
VEGIRVLGEEFEEKAMDDCDSGGAGDWSSDKGPGAKDEGSTAPLPKKIVMALQKGWWKHWKAACEKNQKISYMFHTIRTKDWLLGT